MSLEFGQGVETSGVWSCVGRLNAVTKLVITALVTIGLLLSVDHTTAGVILIGELVALPFFGLRPRTVVVRSGFLVAIAAILTLVNALFSSNHEGYLILDWGSFSLSTGGLVQASAIGLRVLALSLPAVLLLSTTDPTLMADGLRQIVRVPSRYALSMLVGLRVLPLLAFDWREISDARRARGLAGRGPASAVHGAMSRLVGLLVEALRRAVRLSVAMEARGFDPYAARTNARQSTLGGQDMAAVLVCLALVGLATALAVAQGQWSFVLAWPF
ncbi:MAG: energy-coupling factor transporter transmembrane component T [Candidatus Nanopelagicales bacterium]|nr:energy-coupling factor transporter transmembrane component T [Candidatus Nanopelagicales bacterium]